MAIASEHPHALDLRHKLAYDALNDFFRKHAEDVVEIEVLPPAITPPDGSLVLEDGLCVGVPKKVLAAAFIAACSIFFQKRDDSDEAAVQAALDATKVILLFDTEHLTAANFRRRQLHCFSSHFDGELNHAWPLYLELNFLDSILTSPLHRQSKSPTLWNYRSWIMEVFDPWICMCRGTIHDRDAVSPSANFARELNVVLRSGQRHPKNYYAWQYARQLILNAVGGQLIEGDLPLPKRLDHLQSPSENLILKQSVQTVHDWCLRNPSDISAWTFLGFLLLRCPQDKQHVRQVVDKTLEIAHDFRWAHESIWVFLRTVIADTRLISKPDREKYVQEITRECGGNGSPSSKADIALTGTPHPAIKTLHWIRQYTSPRSTD